MMARLAAAALMLAAALPASAAEPATCAAPADLSATPYAGWSAADSGPAEPLVSGTPVTLTLADGAASRGLRVAEAGKYGIAADGKVWIDLAAEGKPLTSVGHGHGPECSGIRKVVWFDLAAGEYQLALSKAVADNVRLLVVKAP